MEGDLRIEDWNGYSIRFVKYHGEWWAVLKDICDALGLRVAKISERLDPDDIERVPVDIQICYDRESEVPLRDVRHDIPNRWDVNRNESDHTLTGVSLKKARAQHGTRIERRWMTGVSERGIYEALFRSRRIEARKLTKWTTSVLQRLRVQVGLEGYEVLQMTDRAVQDEIDCFLDALFYDPETGKLMYSVLTQDGDVETMEADFKPGEL